MSIKRPGPNRAGSIRLGGICVSVALACLVPAVANAWGASGHRMIGMAGVRALPPEVPEFLTRPEFIARLGELSREPDRSKGSGNSHDRDLDPGHYINLDDAGRVGHAISIDALPPSREEYDRALVVSGYSAYQLGYLPYSLIDGWQQVRKDFAYWRADIAAARFADSEDARAWFDEDRRLRELLILRDIGYWSHFVADASQPMHVSVHHNGWGDYPNPEGFTQAKTIHAFFEGRYVAEHIAASAVLAALHPVRVLSCDIESEVSLYLRQSLRAIGPLYRLEKAGQFEGLQPAGLSFAVERLAAGGSELRDMLRAAWRCSAEQNVGYPPVSVGDIEAGTMQPLQQMQGAD